MIIGTYEVPDNVCGSFSRTNKYQSEKAAKWTDATLNRFERYFQNSTLKERKSMISF